MAKIIEKIIQSKYPPNSTDVLWDDGENLKIARNGNFENVMSTMENTGNLNVEATVDNTTGTPSVNITVEENTIKLAFSGLKGETGPQGNSGYQGAAGELKVVNNLTDGGESAALSAKQGKVLKEQLTELSEEVAYIKGNDIQKTYAYEPIEPYVDIEVNMPQDEIITEAYVGENGILQFRDENSNPIPLIGANGVQDTGIGGGSKLANYAFPLKLTQAAKYISLRGSATDKNVRFSTFRKIDGELERINVELYALSNRADKLSNFIGDNTESNIGNELISEKEYNVLISPTNGAETSYDAATASDYIAVEGGTDIYISASMAWGNAVYAFYDTSKTFLTARGTTNNATPTIMVKEKVSVPANAAYVRVCTYGNLEKGKVYDAKKVLLIKEWIDKKWVCIGDSLTEKNSRTSINYHGYVAESTGIEVVNMGVSGTGYKRQEDSGKAFYQRVADIPIDADVITIFGSGNDNPYYSAETLGSATDTGTATIGGCINTTIDNIYARMPLAVIGIISPTPWIGNPPSNPNNGMSRYSALLKDICELRGIPFLDLYHCSALRPDDATFRSLAYSRDEGNGVHPDENGHKLIAPRFKAFLETLIM